MGLFQRGVRVDYHQLMKSLLDVEYLLNSLRNPRTGLRNLRKRICRRTELSRLKFTIHDIRICRAVLFVAEGVGDGADDLHSEALPEADSGGV